MTDIIETDEFLAHFGVKGMKWGSHRSGGGSGGGRGPLIARPSTHGQRILDKNGGSAKTALKKIAIRRLLVAAASVGADSIANSVGKTNPSVGIGIRVVSNLANNTMFGVDAAQAIQVGLAVRKNNRG